MYTGGPGEETAGDFSGRLPAEAASSYGLSAGVQIPFLQLSGA